MVLWHARKWLPTIFEIIKKTDLITNDDSIAIWNKGNVGQTNTPSLYLASCYEQFIYIRKGSPSIIKQGRSNVFNYKPVTSTSKIHPTERPIELIQDVMQTFCWEGSRIMIPFLGSGNSILAASNLGMSAFGWEISQEYKNSFIVRVNESKPSAYRSYKETNDA
jgi:DNA modification methylase